MALAKQGNTKELPQYDSCEVSKAFIHEWLLLTGAPRRGWAVAASEASATG